jgi:hypothetical protein
MELTQVENTSGNGADGTCNWVVSGSMPDGFATVAILLRRKNKRNESAIEKVISGAGKTINCNRAAPQANVSQVEWV